MDVSRNSSSNTKTFVNTFDLNVPDPSDFPNDANAPGLRSLDGALRCTICGELYDGPVVLPCGHCFCSYCIRTAMSDKQECPSCRKVANEGHLKPNLAMEEAVTAWKAARSYVLQLSKENEDRHDATTKIPDTKKRKIRHGDSSPDTIPNAGPSLGLGTPNKRRNLNSSKQKASDNSNEWLDAVPTSDTNEDETPMSNTSLFPKADEIVNCPLCTKRVLYKRLNSHMDMGCKGPSGGDSVNAAQARHQWDKLMGQKKSKGRRDGDCNEDLRIPKASYGTLKDKALKELLSEHDLPVHGDRNQLIARHQRWVMIYNANLDRSMLNRKTKSDLKRELKRWEDDVLKKKKMNVADLAAHEKTHKAEFERLVEVARNNKLRPDPHNGTAGPASSPVNSELPSNLAEE